MSWAMLAYWETLLAEMTMEKMMLWYDLHQLHERYLDVVDSDHFEQLPDLFTEDCVYELVPRQSADEVCPAGIIRCSGRSMLRSGIVKPRITNAFEAHKFRHLASGLEITRVDTNTADMQSDYVVIQIHRDGQAHIYQTGRYFDRVVRMADGWRYQRKTAIYDTSY
ncbi:MAG TPA: nuclear transport factor 2 family protein [Candidatus Binataceae bacterium]|jgi:anthranilate 1,2-dioxygenase small subunit|nr:nuclear transport factor 2 family protein [Candidatus Binataceae bacterium]